MYHHTSPIVASQIEWSNYKGNYFVQNNYNIHFIFLPKRQNLERKGQNIHLLEALVLGQNKRLNIGNEPRPDYLALWSDVFCHQQSIIQKPLGKLKVLWTCERSCCHAKIAIQEACHRKIVWKDHPVWALDFFSSSPDVSLEQEVQCEHKY